jgi:hypothetical protein
MVFIIVVRGKFRALAAWSRERMLEAGKLSRKFETGNWKLETGNWKLERRNWKSGRQILYLELKPSAGMDRRSH